MSEARRPGKQAQLKNNAESPASNKLTFREGTPYEFVVLLQVPRGEAGREFTIKLIPFMKYIKLFVNEDGVVMDNFDKLLEFMDTAKEVWGENHEFEHEIFPTILGMEYGDPRLDKLSLMESFVGFIGALSYVMAGVDAPEVVEAQKK